jgi:hypothetical protein
VTAGAVELVVLPPAVVEEDDDFDELPPQADAKSPALRMRPTTGLVTADTRRGARRTRNSSQR